MILGVLSILIGLSFLSGALLEIGGYWGRPVGMGIGIAGTLVSLLLVLAGVAILRGWQRAGQLVIAAAGSTMVFTSIAGSLHFMGVPAIAFGMGFPVALVVGYLRGESGRRGVQPRPAP